MFPKKLIPWVILITIAALAIAILVIPTWIGPKHWIIRIVLILIVGAMALFWSTGMVTRQEVLDTLSDEPRNVAEIARLIHRARGGYAIDPLVDAGQFFIELQLRLACLRKQARRMAPHRNYSTPTYLQSAAT